MPEKANAPLPIASRGDRPRETRLGLVLYGGVSLAIYIYGVARELFDAVKGRGVYGALKELIDSDIVVDVISGTSAGGINGLVLGRALAANGDIDLFADLWRTKASFDQLLQDPLKSRFEKGEAAPRALMQSEEAYRKELVEAFAKLKPRLAHPLEPHESPVTELDVLVTATDIHGRVWTEQDARGNPIQVKDHRAVFHLKHRTYVDEDDKVRIRKTAFLNPDEALDRALCDGLAQIARATSAFPVAFHPVHYADSKGNARGDPENYYDLMKQTLRGKGFGAETWFTDGGVLDNKPFSHTLETIYFRSADRPVDRKLLYVEPDPERFDVKRETKRPQPEEVAIAALSSIPGYETIADDIRNIENRNLAIRRIRGIVPDRPTTGGKIQNKDIYVDALAIYLADLVAREFRAVGNTLDDDANELFKTALRERILADGDDYLEHLDVAFHVRRHFHAIYEVSRSFEEKRRTPGSKGDETLRFLFRQVKFLHLAEYALATVARSYACTDGFDPARIVTDLEARICGVLSMENLGLELGDAKVDLSTGLASHLYERFSTLALQKEPLERGTSILNAMSDRTRQFLGKARSGSRGIARTAYEVYRWVDSRVFPIQVASNIWEQDEIDLVRISPYDARHPEGYGQRWSLRPQDKISGDAFFHFGGFLKRSWRSNDIFWGRMDGLEILVDTLYPPDRHDDERAKKALGMIGDWLDEGVDIEACARDPEQVKTMLLRAGRRWIAARETPRIAADVHLDRRRMDAAKSIDTGVESELKTAIAEKRWDDFDHVVDTHVRGIGKEDLSDVDALNLFRIGTQIGFLFAKALKVRSGGVQFVGGGLKWVSRVVELPLALLHLLARSLGLGHMMGPVMLVALLTGTVFMAVMLFVAWPSKFPPLWALLTFAMLLLMTILTRVFMSKRVRRDSNEKETE